MKKLSIFSTICPLGLLFATCAAGAQAQTFEIGNQQQQQAAPAQKGKKKSNAQNAPASPSEGLGWGSSIEVGRLARAAEDALKRGNYMAAADFAERATKAAPQNPKLWFLLGYTARLAGRTQTSVDAYQRGLKFEPNNTEGLSGLAQTYLKMGRTADAKRLLAEALSKKPNQNDYLIAGDLYLRTGDTQQGIAYLQRAENMKPNAHAELLMAIAYMKLKQPVKAKAMLDQAKRRDPKNVAVFRAVANYYREERDYKDAILTLKNAPGKNTEVLADLGYTYELAGDKKEAADTYVTAANIAPQQIGLQLSAAQALLRIGEMDKVRQYLGRAQSIDANHYRLHAIRALLARTENRPDEAIREYNFALSHIPESAPEGQLYPIQLRLNLSELYRETGDMAAAKQQVAIAENEMSKLQLEGPAKAEFLRVRASIRMVGDDFAGAERDLKEALQLDPGNINVTLQYANLLWRTKRKAEARKIYADVLSKDHNNRFALEAMGYLFREDNDIKGAVDFFNRLAAAYPDDYVPYVALGDLFTATRDFPKAEQNYEQAYKRAPENTVVIANAANAAIESHQVKLAGDWVARAKGKMQDDPRIMLQRERYLFHNGKYLEAEQLGQKVIQLLPKERNASVYLAYALYNLGRYDDVLALTEKYTTVLPKEPNFPLLSGHVHKQSQLLDEAVDDYTHAISLDPAMPEIYINRGYVLNDLQNPEQASTDFKTALKVQPNNGIAHLGLAFSDLQLRRGKEAVEEADAAERLLGENGATHLVRATAFRQQRLLDRAEKEYVAALKYAPDDLRLHLALADTQYHLRKYNDSLNTLNAALRLSPDDAFIYSQMAHATAEMRRRDDTLRYIQAAERAQTEDQGAIFLATGDALLSLGDREGAMERFARALDAPDSNRVDARLAIARLFARDRQYDDARQQIALAFAESRIGEAAPVTADNLIEAANLFLGMNDFDLAQRYFERAKMAGAADQVVAIGLANTYLARGQSLQAQAQLATLGSPADNSENYDYTLAMANVYRQRHQDRQALSMFARANQMSGEDTVAEQGLQEMAGIEGYRINDRLSFSQDLSLQPLFEDQTIYELDRKLFGLATSAGTLPPPRSSLETRWTNGFRVHQNGLPPITGFFQLRNANGQVSLPQKALIINRNTFDYAFNGGINPVLHLGPNSFTFNTGLQYTLRRDKESPLELDQNLFRQYVYMSSSAIANWVAIRGYGFHEAGPFTQQDLSSRELGADLQFIVGRPWGRTSLLTEYSIRDLQYHPGPTREFFETSTRAGIQHKFGQKLTIAALAEYIRSWRVQDTTYAIAQAMRPAAEFEYKANNRWSVNGTFGFSRGQGSHDYDNVQSGFFISYVRPMHRMLDDGSGEVRVEYPLRFSFGIEQASYFNFTGSSKAIIRPIVRLTFF